MKAGGIRLYTLTLQFLFLIACAPLITEAQVAPSDQEAVDELLNFDTYLISNLVGEYYAVRAVGLYGPDDAKRAREQQRYDLWPKRKMNEVYILDKTQEKGFELMSDPMFDGIPGALARIAPNSGSVMSEVLCFYRNTHDNKIYEYWVVKIWNSTSGTRTISFLVTVAEALEKPRQILEMNSKYIRDFRISENYTISFPESDLSALFRLQAWIYPVGFPDSELKRQEVYISTNGDYIAEPYDPDGGVRVWSDITPKEVEEFFRAP